MEIKSISISGTSDSHWLSGYVFYNAETKKAMFEASVGKGYGVISSQWGGCLCRCCIFTDSLTAYHEFVKIIKQRVADNGLELTESCEDDDELTRKARNGCLSSRGWWRSQGLTLHLQH